MTIHLGKVELKRWLFGNSQFEQSHGQLIFGLTSMHSLMYPLLIFLSKSRSIAMASVRCLRGVMSVALLCLCFSYPAMAAPPKEKCQAAMGGPEEAELGCVGRVGLLRLSKDVVGPPVMLRYVTMSLFGQEELPEVGSEINIRRSAHLREWYDEERDEQLYSLVDVPRNQPAVCTGWCEIEPKQAYCFGFFPSKKDFDMVRDCPGPTDQTQYLGVNTKVKILGYQQLGNLFVKVQILVSDSKDPVEEDEYYEFDRDEIF